MELRPDIARHLDRLRDRLLEIVQLRGLYLYGSLTTGDFSPARPPRHPRFPRAAQPHGYGIQWHKTPWVWDP